MNWWHRHKWVEESREVTRGFDTAWGQVLTKSDVKDRIPDRIETRFLLRCEGCGDVTVRMVSGAWATPASEETKS